MTKLYSRKWPGYIIQKNNKDLFVDEGGNLIVFLDKENAENWLHIAEGKIFRLVAADKSMKLKKYLKLPPND